MTTVYLVAGALMGIVFGFALEKGRVFEPGMIVGQFQLRNFTVAKMFLTAIATTTVVFLVLTTSGFATLHPKAAIYPATVGGGLLFGAGMALTGACPGTVLAQIGAGYRDAWFTVLGGILGALAYGYANPYLAPMSDGPGEITLADSSGLAWWIVALIALPVMLAVLFGLERYRAWQADLGRDADGIPSGAATRNASREERSTASPTPTR